MDSEISAGICFVCLTLIGVKSKYGSCSGNCTGLIIFNNNKYMYYILFNIVHIRKVPFVGTMGWAVNSIAKAVEGSSPFLPISILII